MLTNVCAASDCAPCCQAKMADAEDDEQFLYGGKWVSSLCFCLIDDQIALVLETCLRSISCPHEGRFR